MTRNETLILYVRIIEEAYAESNKGKNHELYLQFSKIISNDENQILIALRNIEPGKNPFAADNIFESLVKVHHYVETEVGKKIRSFETLKTSEIMRIQDALGRAWDSTEKTSEE